MNKFERNTLLQYIKMREQSPTTAGIMVRSWKHYTFLVVLLASICLLAIVLEIRMIAIVATGLVAGAVLRDIGYARRLVRVWPLLEEIMDWNRIEKKMADQSSGSNSV